MPEIPHFKRPDTPLLSPLDDTEEFKDINRDRDYAATFGQLPDPAYSLFYADRAGLPTESQEQHARNLHNVVADSYHSPQTFYTHESTTSQRSAPEVMSQEDSHNYRLYHRHQQNKTFSTLHPDLQTAYRAANTKYQRIRHNTDETTRLDHASKVSQSTQEGKRALSFAQARNLNLHPRSHRYFNQVLTAVNDREKRHITRDAFRRKIRHWEANPNGYQSDHQDD
jgi:hypothetical protein